MKQCEFRAVTLNGDIISNIGCVEFFVDGQIIVNGEIPCKSIMQLNDGIEYGNQQAYECGVYNGHAEGLAEGIKEVVDWINKRSDDYFYITIPQDEWQAKLKEWGI